MCGGIISWNMNKKAQTVWQYLCENNDCVKYLCEGIDCLKYPCEVI